MHLYLVRHGEAEDVAPRGGGDAARRLTSEGRRAFSRLVRGLAELDLGLTRILTSPYVRARETAEILHAQLPGPVPEEWALLVPDGAPERLLHQLHGAGDAVALVGHEPVLGWLLSLAVAGRASSGTSLRKGAVAHVEFAGAPKPGGGQLAWMVTPKLVRRLGRAE